MLQNTEKIMATYVTADDFRKWAYIEEGVDDDKIERLLKSAEKTVDREVAKFKGNTLALLAAANGDELPEDAVEAILIRATQSYNMPDGMRSSSIGLDGHYWEIIHNLSEEDVTVTDTDDDDAEDESEEETSSEETEATETEAEA